MQTVLLNTSFSLKLITDAWLCFFVLNGISTFVGYSMPNPSMEKNVVELFNSYYLALGQTVVGLGLYVNTNKKEHNCFKPK